MLLLIFMTTLVSLLTVDNVKSANILVAMPVSFYSHHSGVQPVLHALAARGHNVTILSPYPQKKPVANITDIIVPNFFQNFIAKNAPKDDFLSFHGITSIMFAIWELGANTLGVALQDDQIQKLIKSNDDTKFDLIMAETLFANELFVAFGHKFKAPVVNLFPALLFPSGAYLTGNDFPPSYVPVVRTSFSDRMTFWERVQNTFFYWWDIFIGHVYYLKLQENLLQKYFVYPGSENRPPLEDMLRNTSLTLVDLHFSIGYPTPMHKNIVPYGGGYLKAPGKLPKDLQDLMDNAREGIIYLSFGSGTTLSSLRPELQRAVLSALSKVKQTVLMRLQEPTLPQEFRNKNIIVRDWFPQAAILAHPNCKLFITHCGLHGIMEAVQYAVPMVATPLIADQHYNSLFLESAGIAYRVPPQEISEQKLSLAIRTVLTDPKYKENIKTRSAIFKDNPMDMMDNAIYWIEYVIRHKGAPHLRPAVLDLYWYQRLMLDVIAFYLLLIFLIVYILVKIIRLFFKLITWMCCSKVSKNKKSKKE
ncbi:hypothetical protein O3M35_003013 [Rhynocoris fuscipes]|uniref:UDP-glucuronosyltransferase n=1 Tax=Rhynocoris fuscipes TaxID=488301 RepID=A0AAW1CNH2_9HEMI